MINPTRSQLFRVLSAAVLALALLVSLRPSAEAAFFRNHIARVPDTPTSAETVTIWIESDTASGETAGVETLINGVYTNHYGTFDDTNGPDPSNWKVILPAQSNGTTVQYQLFTRNQSNQNYGHTGFNWSYTVNDGDVQWDGLKHDTFDNYYRNPFGAVPADTDVTLRFRTIPLDVDSVDLRVYTYDPATDSTSGSVDHPMTYLEDVGGYAFWTITLDTPNTPALLYYHFVVTDGLDVDYYSDDHGGPHDNLNQGGTGAAGDNQGTEGFQLTIYDPAFETPDWLQDAVVYQIFPDRFRNGDSTNDYCRGGSTSGCPLFYGNQDILLREPWNTLIGDPRTPGEFFNTYGTQFYGGDLQGLIDKLDYLQAAGFDTIYTTPIFDGSSNHRYDTDNYMEIDPALGDLTTFDTLIDELNARGMKLIVDGVFNHTSSDSVYFDRYGRYAGNDGACESLASDYRDWFEFLNSDVPCDTGDYTGWFGYDSLAVLVDGEDEVRDFIYRDANSVMETWYDRGVHGWRFDVADEISHNWWRDFRPYAKADAADGPLVGEVWPDASKFLLGDQLDSVMNYRFRKNVLGFIRSEDWNDNDNNGNNEIIDLTPSQFDRALRSVREDYPPEATLAMLNLLDSHDTNRALYLMEILGDSDLTEAKQRLQLAALFQYTYMGAPMVYYGDEVALNSPSLANHVTNGPEDDPYNRAPYPWDDESGDINIYGPADSSVLAVYSLLGNLRHDNEALRSGAFATLLTGDTTASGTDNTTYAFARDGGSETAIVALNPGSNSNNVVIPVSDYYSNGHVLEDRLTGTDYTVSSGSISLALPARTGILLMEPTPTSLTVRKVVVGTSPGAPWEFGGDQGSFTLPAAGGETTFSPLPANSSQIIAETDLAGWAASVACSPGGETGTTFVAVTLGDGVETTCTFTNTLCLVGYYDNGTACTPADPGHYVDTDGAAAQLACVPGYYQPDSAAILCIEADAGYYVDTPAATEQTACPVGTTSPAGSDSIGDCVSTTATLTISKTTDPAGGTDFPFTLDPGAVTFADKWGSNGVGQGDFNGPFGIAVDGDGNIYVADTFAYRVQKFDADGNFILMWGKDVKSGAPTGFEICLAAETCKAGTSGTGNGEFNLPHGIAVDGNGNVYVSDSSNHRIQKFDVNGNYLDQWGGIGGAGGQFDTPNGVAVDGAGNVYVADSFNNRIQKFAGDGTFLLTWGYDVVDDGTTYAGFEICTPSDICWAGIGGNGDGQLDDPFGVAVYGGRVYVADTFNHRIQTFDLDATYLDQWGSEGSGNGQFKYPYGLTADAAGNVYVADSNAFTGNTNDRIQKFDADGDYLGQWGSEGTNDGQFDMPTGVAVSGAGVYVVENENHRVQRFSQTGATLDDGQSHPFEDLAPGSYLLSELVPADWTLSDIDCDGGSPVENGNTVSVTLAGGDDVTCTFSNTQDEPSDTTPPNTTIDTGPTGTTNSDDATFTFSSDEVGSTFTCQLDGGATEACNSGSISYTDLDEGDHTFVVYACDAVGNCDASPAMRTWTVDTTGPEVIVTSAPSDPSDDITPSFEFTSESGATFQCRIDSDSFAPCTSGDTFGPLGDGEHTFEVRATDTTGNTGAADSHTWTIDTTPGDTDPPETTIDTAPPALTTNNDPSFTFSSDETGSTFECKLDTGAWEACNGGTKSYTDVADGEHTFQVQATDAAGNSDPTPDSHTWTINTTPGSGAIYMTAAAGSIAGGPTFQENDILKWDGDVWSVWFDGSAAGLQVRNAVHNINAFAIVDADGDEVIMAFSQNRRFVPDITTPVDGMDLVRWDGDAFSLYFDGSDVGLTQKTPEKIDGLHILPGSASPINGGNCLAYLLISTQGSGKTPKFGGGTLSFDGEDVLGFCATSLGATTTGHWHKVVDGSDEGMPKNSTDSLSMSADGNTLYLTTKSTFNVDGATGGHSMIYAYDMTSHTFSGPLFRATDEGLNRKVDGLDVIGDLP